MKKLSFLAALTFGLVVTDAALAENQMNGVWQNGVWQNGIWSNGVWQNGVWQNGVWQNGVWQNGVWQNGTASGAMTLEGVELVDGQLVRR
jgi:hypothetical protein